MKAFLVLLMLAIMLTSCAVTSPAPGVTSSVPTGGVAPQIPTSTSAASSPQAANTQISILKKSTGKLSSRLEALASSPTLQNATLEEQARALSLPATGPGSLIRDEQGRILVTIRMDDTSAANLQALAAAGATVVNVSQSHQTLTAFIALNDLQAAANLQSVQSIQEELSPGG